MSDLLFAGMIIGSSLFVLGEYYYTRNEDSKNRAAETVLPPQEKKEPMKVKASKGKPVMMPSRGYVSSAFNPMNGSYTPLADLPEGASLDEIKSLNIANRFLYG